MDIDSADESPLTFDDGSHGKFESHNLVDYVSHTSNDEVVEEFYENSRIIDNDSAIANGKDYLN